MPRRLIFSKDSPTNTVLTDEGSGQVFYMFKTPRAIGTQYTTIYHASGSTSKYLTPHSPGGASSSIPQPPSPPQWGEQDQPMMRVLGQIEHTTFTPSILRFGGVHQVTTKDFFRKDPGFWKSKKIWTAPDGRELVWNYGSKYTKLTRNNEEKTLIALYHNPWKLIGKSSIYLEIYPEGEDIIDWIVFTFAYIQKLREEEEENWYHS